MNDAIETSQKFIYNAFQAKDAKIQNQASKINSLKQEIETLKSKLLSEDKILSDERKSLIQNQIKDFLLNKVILNAKVDGKFTTKPDKYIDPNNNDIK